jgi:hypothetical protein
MHLPIDDGEHQLQVLCDLRSSALMHFRDDASAAQRAADESGIVPHAPVRPPALGRLPRPWRLRQGGLQLAAAPPATSHEKRTSGVRGQV